MTALNNVGAPPKDDFMSNLIAVEEQGDRLNEEELLALCVLLLFAGSRDDCQLHRNALLALLRDQEQLQSCGESRP